MKFTPRKLRENVNVTQEHPLQELLVLVAGIFGVLLAVYLVLGFLLDLVVPRIGPDFERQLGALFLPSFAGEAEDSASRGRLQQILDQVAEAEGAGEGSYRLHLVDSPEANAIALPGGHIVVLAGLVKEAGSENELAMVLGHELGHFKNRDHLRGLGRGLVLLVFSSALFGADSPVSRLSSLLLGGAEMSFSRQQEREADAWGLELLVGTYGHAGGATDFFRRISEQERAPELAYLFASHPYPAERLAALEELIEAKRYPVLVTRPLATELRGVEPGDE